MITALEFDLESCVGASVDPCVGDNVRTALAVGSCVGEAAEIAVGSCVGENVRTAPAVGACVGEA